MSGDYPPGVTGMEPEIIGYPDEAELYDQARARIDATPELARHRATLLYPGYDWTAHLEWIIAYPVAEIVSWAEAIEGDEVQQ